MLREFNGRTARWSIVLALLVALSTPAAADPLAKLVDAVLRNGPSSQLPARLSVVLGVSRAERATPVKQAVMREGPVVRTFNVCTARHEDVVLIQYDEQRRSSKAYLVSPTGALRKAVSYQAGAPASERSAAEAADDFAKEIKFWTDLGNAPAGPK